MANTATKIEAAVQNMEYTTKTITELELAQLLTDKQKYKRVHAEDSALKKQIEAAEKDVLARLEAGAPVEDGLFTVAIDKSTTRTEPIDYKAIVHDMWKREGKSVDVEEAKLKAQCEVNTYPKLAIMMKFSETK
jgi:hypothetical protein